MLIAVFSAFALSALVLLKRLLSQSGIRYLVDSYGLDKSKLSRLNKQEIAALRKSIDQLRKNNDAFSLGDLIRRYKP